MTDNKEILDLSRRYDDICDEYVSRLNEMWDFSCGFWVSDERGGLYCFNDEYSITMEDLRFCVDNGVSYEEFVEWFEYECFIAEYGGNRINLMHWHMGNHGIPKDKRDQVVEEHARIERLKQEFLESVSELTSKY